MAIPSLWSKTRERLRYTPTGSTYVEEWHGPSGASKATRDEFKAEFSGYIDLEFVDNLPLDNGNAECNAVITWAANSDGEIINSGDPDYGLISRTWTLVGSDEQLEIEAHDNVIALSDKWEPWPQLIRSYVESYKKRVKQDMDAWNANPTYTPVLPEWRVPTPVDGGIQVALTDLDIANAEAYAMLLARTDHPTFETSRFVLRKVETVTSWSTILVAHANVNRYHTWSALNNSEPTLASTGQIQAAGLQDLIWLKKTPEDTYTTGGNRELTQEYHGSYYPESGTNALVSLQFQYGAVLT